MSEIQKSDADFELLAPELIVLDERDFLAAVATAADAHDAAARWTPVDARTAEQAAYLAGAANYPGTIAVIARADRGSKPVAFSGELFAVARDASIDGPTGLVRARTFRIAAVQLRGTAAWVGTDARFEQRLGQAAQPGRCCGKPTICVPTGGTGGGGGGGPILDTGPVLGVSSPNDPLFADPVRSRGNPVALDIYSAANGIAEFGCKGAIDDGCAAVKPWCEFGDVGFTLNGGGEASIPVGSNPCGDPNMHPVRGRYVPKECTYSHIGPDGSDAGCNGTFAKAHVAAAGGNESSLRLFCEAARFVPGSGSPCETQTAQQKLVRQQQLALEAGGWLPGMRATKHCDAPGKHGTQRCVVCEPGAGCHETLTVPPVDPTIADDTGHFDVVPSKPAKAPAKPAPPKAAPPPPAPAAAPPKPEQAPAAATPPAPPPAPVPAAPAAQAPLPTHPETSPPSAPEPKTFVRAARNPVDDFDRPEHAKPTVVGDPVDPGDGSLTLVHTDLSFRGPVRDLVFTRSYRSASRLRSSLGSNWVHNWDVFLEPLTAQTLPSWLSPWSAGMPGAPTTLMLQWGSGSGDLFFLDVTTGLFLPNAGSAATVARTVDGWALRFPDGRVLVFAADGYLVRDVDRFGNAFTIDYEPTPLGRLFDYYCTPAALSARNETLAARRNALLAWLVGEGQRPTGPRAEWVVTSADFPLPRDPILAAPIAYARDYLLYLASHALPPESIDGGRKRRPTTITDPLGRTLQFSYWEVAGPTTRRGAFAAVPAAGLLRGVDGPEETRVRFSYERPPQYPAELNEAFLTKVDRSDAGLAKRGLQPASARDTVFSYQWPAGPTPSYDGWADAVEQRFLAYYKTFVGCRYDAVEICLNGGSSRVPEYAPGDPAQLAHLARVAYISDVADNILAVTQSGTLEVESRYPADPFDTQFDRVVSQRYGSWTAIQDPLRIPADQPTDRWLGTMPKATFEYCEAGRGATGVADRTEAFLPAAIRARYPLEAAPLAITGRIEANATPATGGCDYTAMVARRAELPGWHQLVDYYDPPAGGGLMRTSLTPNQLIGAQVGDPTHNDLISQLAPNPGDVTQPLIERIVGRRAITASNNNRICSWIRVIDRDGDIRYLGLNYRGQTLVDAVQEAPAHFVFSERLYNADGSLVEQRRPSRSTAPWTSANGGTRYSYDEIDPRGNRGWDAWLPVYWARRLNLVSIEVLAPGTGVLDDDEHGGFVVGVGRFTRYEREPLFNQISSIEQGSIRAGGTIGTTTLPPVQTVHRRVDLVFDYQELAGDVRPNAALSIDPLLDALRPWGFHWLRDDPEAFAFQLRRQLYGVDINGDGANGNAFAGSAARRGIGVPVARTEERPGVSSSELLWLYTWAPHGALGSVDGPDGRFERYDYYSNENGSGVAPFGNGKPPAADSVSAGFTGMLAQVTTSLTRPDYPLTGPSAAAARTLAGPYRWIGIDPSSVDAADGLLSLGLPQDQIDDLLAAVGRAASTVVAMAYNGCGHLTDIFHANGNRSVTTDTDGRVLEAIDERGTGTTTTRDAFGRATRETVNDASGNTIGDRRWEYDEADHVLTEIVALEVGGANNPATGAHTVSRHTYTPEGAVKESVDPEGLLVRRRYDARKRLIEVATSVPGAATPSRTTSFVRDVDGRIEAVHRGAFALPLPGPMSTTQRFHYDGLGRVISTVDERGFAWQQAWSARDRPTRQRRFDQAYPTPSSPQVSWECDYAYDDYGRLTRRRVNGIVSSLDTRTAAGVLVSMSANGRGTTWIANDLLGREVWRLDPSGTETITTRCEQPHRTITSIVRRDAALAPHVTSTSTMLDATDQSTLVTLLGGDHGIATTVERDGVGRVSARTGPLGERLEFNHNLAGWAMRIRELTTAGGAFTEMLLARDGRGTLRNFEDPAGELARFDVDGLGQRSGTEMSGAPALVSTASYDPIGRVSEHSDGQFHIARHRDVRHDPISDTLVPHSGRGVDVIRRGFDDLGRVARIEHTNPMLTWLPESARTVVTALEYDQLGRLRREQTAVGTGAPATTVSTWSLLTPSRWRRVANLSLGAWQRTSQDDFDDAGRLESTGPVGAAAARTTFRWMGDRYAGRSQPQLGWSSRFEEHVEHDELAAVHHVAYRAIDIDAARQPVDSKEGSRYSPAGWDADVCSIPLFELTAARDAGGRIALETWRHGQPVVEPSGGLHVAGLPARLRGYVSTLRSRLSTLWEDDARTATAVPVLRSYTHTAAELQSAVAGAGELTYNREPATEDLQSIANAKGATLWSLTTARTAGHQLTGATINGHNRKLSYDQGGRVTAIGTDVYTWHPTGELATVTRNGALLEGYAYDGLGRLAAVYHSQSTVPVLQFVYDEDHAVAAVDAMGRPLWEAQWGPLVDQLIAWRYRADPATEFVPLLDLRHSVMGVWQPSSATVPTTATYTPEGRLTVRDSADAVICHDRSSGTPCSGPGRMPFTFVGAYRSPVTGHVLMRNRWYAPDLGQFLSPDPAWFADGTNRYAYANGDPVNRTDPSGLASRSIAELSTAKGLGKSLLAPVRLDDGIPQLRQGYPSLLEKSRAPVGLRSFSDSPMTYLRALMKTPQKLPEAELNDVRWELRARRIEADESRKKSVSAVIEAFPIAGPYMSVFYDLLTGDDPGAASTVGKEVMEHTTEHVAEHFAEETGLELVPLLGQLLTVHKMGSAFEEHSENVKAVDELRHKEYDLLREAGSPNAWLEIAPGYFRGPEGELYKDGERLSRIQNP